MELIPLTDGTRIATWTDGTAPLHDMANPFPPVVILHGGPGLWSGTEHAELASLISDQTVVHRYDQRGCGRSEGTEDHAGADGSTPTIAQYVADLEALRLHWQDTLGGHERWIVLGHSFGASLALAYAGAHPEHVAAVVYLDGTGIGDWRTPYRAERERRIEPWRERFEELDARGFRSEGPEDQGRTGEEEVEWRALSWVTDFADPSRSLGKARALAAVDLPINWHVNRALVHDPGISDPALTEALGRIDVPVWFVHGSLDPRPIGPVRNLASHANRSHKRVIEGAGHSPWIEQPDRVREVLEEVLHSAGTSPAH